MAAYEPAGSRMRIVRLPEGRVLLDDCYNANPQSVTAALEVLARTECDRQVAVLGDMGELGDLTAQAHYNMPGRWPPCWASTLWRPSAQRPPKSRTAPP